MDSSTAIPGLDQEESDAWRALIGTTVWLPAALDLQLQRDAGITHFEYGVMSALVHQPKQAMRMKELARVTNSALSRLSKVVDRLSAQGWVERQPDPDDGRVTQAVLTKAGRRKVAAATPGHIATVRSLVFDRITPAQAREMQAVLSGIVDAAGPDGACVSRKN
ncbi:MarR family winged helix-turn-helix transcriptional regulator [Microbacterium sp. NE2HP2]|uniref:MarR family winged helix-turn-helix transcriptional regulator n=1 Tax=Microbacterium TaxID=33882 RepID=UPI002366697E|nr:MarR family winged helix-turn-helix transcriptional regulator [Microbacterium plantarum]MDD7945343.1 MarR family winged helix-turn-helix transcriptional regulator [Microbacterium plantarum]